MGQKRIFGTLRSRIFSALFAISMIPIAALGVQGYHCAMEAVYELAHKHVLAVAHGRARSVLSWIEERTSRVETMATLPTTGELVRAAEGNDDASRDRLQQTLDVFRASNPTFGEVVVLDGAWRPLASSHLSGDSHHTLVDEDLQARAIASDGAVFGLAHGHAAGDVGLHVVCAIAGASGQPVGFLAAYLDLGKRLTPLLQNRQGLYDTGKVYIVSADNRILTEPLSDEEVGFMPWRQGAVDSSHHHGVSSAVSSYRDYRGSRVLGAAIPIGFEGWQLVTEIERDEALVWLDVLLVRTLSTVFVTCVLVVLIAFWMTQLMGKPLRQLMEIAHRVRRGYVGERLEAMDVAEAEEVRMAFNAMLDELKEKQEELVRTTTLAYVGELTSSTVHEMRNPLSSIKMNLQVLTRAEGQLEGNQELGEIALQQATRLDHMLTDLLSFGKPVEMKRTYLSFTELSDSVRDVMEGVATLENTELVIEDQLEGRALFVDKEQFCRVLSNLIGNALEAMADGGVVRVGARRVGEPHGMIEIVVEDTGPGFSQEALQRSFQPFYTTKINGTGLGLPNVKKIVELHGGTITVENRSEGGAVFRIHLPDHATKEG